MDVNVQAGGDGPVGVVPCENCGKPSHKRCSRCKAFAVCDKACMAAIWRRHKPDCNNVVATQKQLNEAGTSVSGVPWSIDPDAFFRLNRLSLDVYTKYGVEEPPGRKSKMNVDKKSAFFLDFLKVHDSSSPENKNAPLPEKLFLNRRYNNAYSHAMKTLTFLELDRLNALMQKHHIGTANRMCQ
ncbi:MYND finger [Phytophthora infestans]|uniref:MYND finger n=1 Tax=Phytophthora infestans TaxID=4787 RepID=A0A833SNN3_PHYIN|nr:MYND finger [Phytophthora infestans]KAF4137650.1 MYND finger [Phytophthora infestans]